MLWDVAKAVPGGKLIAMHYCINNNNKMHTLKYYMTLMKEIEENTNKITPARHKFLYTFPISVTKYFLSISEERILA